MFICRNPEYANDSSYIKCDYLAKILGPILIVHGNEYTNAMERLENAS